MAWNGSGGGDAAPKASKKSASSPVWAKGALAGVLVVAICAAVLYVMRPGEKADGGSVAKKPQNHIAETMPQLPAAEERAAAADVKPAAEPKTKPTKAFEVVNGIKMLSNGSLWPTNRVKHYKAKDIRRAKTSIFDNRTDNELAALMMLEPGQSLIGGARYHKDYKADFLEAIKKPIQILDTDSEAEVEIKRAVMDARKELKAAIDRGENPEDIIKEAYSNSQKLAQYRQAVLKQVKDIARESPELSDADLDDLIAASNKMLEDKGIAPLKFTAFAKARMRTDVRTALSKAAQGKVK